MAKHNYGTDPGRNDYQPPTLEEIERALYTIPADCSESEWKDVGMAIAAELGGNGLELFDRWSSTAPTKYDQGDIKTRWRRWTRGSGKTIKTLFYIAKIYGYRPEQRSNPPSSEELSRREQQRAERCRQDEAERRRREEEAKHAADRSERLWASGNPAGADHGYLSRKGIGPHDLRVFSGDLTIAGLPLDGCLMVPAQDVDGQIHSIEFIHPTVTGHDGKRWLPNGAARGRFHLFGELNCAEMVYIVEGIATAATIHEATGAPTICAFNAGWLQPAAEGIRNRYAEVRLVFAADDDASTTGNPGLTKAREAARAVGGLVAVPDFGPDRPAGATDFNDLAQYRGLDTVRRCLDAARPPDETDTAAPEPDEDAPDTDPDETELNRLAQLTPLQYDREREETAERLGVRVGTLDKEISRRRPQAGSDTAALIERIDLWPTPVDGGELAETIKETLQRHAVLPEGAEIAIPLWVLGTYAFDGFNLFPRLLLSSPEKRCGKSTLLECLDALCYRALTASNATPAALFRLIELCRPSLLLDEVDTFLDGNEDLRGIINSGHSRVSAFVIRCDGENMEPKRFSTWAPMVLAGIGKPGGTITDRSVIVTMRRKLPGESVAKKPINFRDELTPMRRRCLRWAADHAPHLKQAAPELPESGNDRALDNWTPLLAIADRLGRHWPQSAREAFHTLTPAEDDSIGPMILADIRRVFQGQNIERIHSDDLVSELVGLDDRPWSEWKRGRPLTANSLSRLLDPFGIKSQQLRVDNINRHGYALEQFRDAFERYLPPVHETDSTTGPDDYLEF